MINSNTRKTIFFGLLLVIGFLIPLIVQSGYWLHVFIMAYFWGLLSASWSLLSGYAGQFSFAHIALVTIAGYTSGLLGMHFDVTPLLGMVAGVALAGGVGLLIALLCLRLKGAYLALFTIAFSEILRVTLNAEHTWTRGQAGLPIEPLFSTTSKVPYYYTMFALLISCFIIMYRLVKSRYGLFFRSIREDEQAASAMGVNIVRYKIMAFVVTSLICGVAGVFYAHFTQMLSPNFTTIATMGLVIAMAVIGGVESLTAAALGGILLEFGLEYLRDFGAWRLVIFGALLMITVRFARNGLIYPVCKKIAGKVS